MPKPQLSRNSSGLYKPRAGSAAPTAVFTMPDDFIFELARLITPVAARLRDAQPKRLKSLHL